MGARGCGCVSVVAAVARGEAALPFGRGALVAASAFGHVKSSIEYCEWSSKRFSTVKAWVAGASTDLHCGKF